MSTEIYHGVMGTLVPKDEYKEAVKVWLNPEKFIHKIGWEYVDRTNIRTLDFKCDKKTAKKAIELMEKAMDIADILSFQLYSYSYNNVLDKEKADYTDITNGTEYSFIPYLLLVASDRGTHLSVMYNDDDICERYGFKIDNNNLTLYEWKMEANKKITI